MIGGFLPAEFEPGPFVPNDRVGVTPLPLPILKAGITEVDIDAEGRIPKDQLDEFQAAMSTTYGHAEHVARAVEYVLTQPSDVNVEELIIRPPKSLC